MDQESFKRIRKEPDFGLMPKEKDSSEPDQQSAEKKIKPKAKRNPGSRLDAEHGTRTMKVYTVSGPEMASLKAHSVNSSLAFTFAGAFLGYAIDIYINASFSSVLTGEALFATEQLAPCLIVIAVLFAIFGGKSFWDKRSLWAEIEKSTKHPDLQVRTE